MEHFHDDIICSGPLVCLALTFLLSRMVRIHKTFREAANNPANDQNNSSYREVQDSGYRDAQSGMSFNGSAGLGVPDKAQRCSSIDVMSTTGQPAIIVQSINKLSAFLAVK
jgi:hypothetical protein